MKPLRRARTTLLVLLTHQVALPLLKKIRKPIAFNYNLEQLGALPGGTLGKDLFDFLGKRNLPLLPHYARHDLKHVLLGYDTTDAGEACLQSFMLGNGRVSFPVLATVFYAYLTMPEYWKQIRQAYREGKRCKPFHGWDWNQAVTKQTEQLRKIIYFKTACPQT